MHGFQGLIDHARHLLLQRQQRVDQTAVEGLVFLGHDEFGVGRFTHFHPLVVQLAQAGDRLAFLDPLLQRGLEALGTFHAELAERHLIGLGCGHVIHLALRQNLVLLL